MAKPPPSTSSPKARRSATLYLVRTLPAARDAVWRALTVPREWHRWFGPEEGYTLAALELDARPKGTYRVAMKPPDEEPLVVSGTFRDVRPEEWLVFTWEWQTDRTWSTASANARPPETTVTMVLRGGAQGTELLLTHEGFLDEKERDDHAWGWRGCLTRLAHAL